MRIFQFFVNPKIKPDWVVDCFCFSPKDSHEAKLGSLYLICNLKSSSLSNSQFLRELAFLAKESFFKKISSSSKNALEETLKSLNEFLKKKIKEGVTHWLGNLGIVVLNFKEGELLLAIGGEMKIQILRGGKIFEMEEKIKSKKTKARTLNFFSEIAIGKLIKDDVLLVENEELYSIFKKIRIFEMLKEERNFNENSFKKFIIDNKLEFTKTTGICFVLEYSDLKEKTSNLTILPEKKEKFSIIQALKEKFSNKNFEKEKIKESILFLFRKKWVFLFLLFFLLLLLGYFLTP